MVSSQNLQLGCAVAIAQDFPCPETAMLTEPTVVFRVALHTQQGACQQQSYTNYTVTHKDSLRTIKSLHLGCGAKHLSSRYTGIVWHTNQLGTKLFTPTGWHIER